MLRSSSRFLLAVAVVLPLACSRSPRQGGPDRQQPASRPEKEESGPELAPQLLKARLDAPQPPAYATADPLGKDTWPTVRRLYEANGYQPVWIVDGHPRPEIAAVREAVGRAAEDGLNPADYDLAPADTL